MPRKHLFPLVVLLGAVVVAGLLAVTQSVDLGQPASASTSTDPAIGFRLQKLDRFERSLRQQLAAAASEEPAAPQTVYRRAPATSGPAVASHGDHEDDDRYESEDEGRDD